MASYKDRLTRDLDNWIAGGLVPLSSRITILSSVGERRAPDTATALAYVGTALLGLAVVAFVAANWSGIPRVGRYGLITGLFAAAAIGAAWASARRWSNTANALLAFAALVFAADIGLTGQIFDLSGDPQTALYGAAGAALLMALAGRSSGAAMIALTLAALGDMAASQWTYPCVIVAGAIAAAGLAQWWKSPVLAHGAGAATLAATAEIVGRLHQGQTTTPWATLLAAAAVLAALAFGARTWTSKLAPIVGAWLVAGALVFFAFAGSDASGAWMLIHRLAWIGLAGGIVMLGRVDDEPALQIVGWIGFWFAVMATGFEYHLADGYQTAWRIGHRIVCLAGASAMIAQGRSDGRNWLTGLGVVAMLASICIILSDFGLSLMAAAGVFAASAAMALVVGLILRRRAAS